MGRQECPEVQPREMQTPLCAKSCSGGGRTSCTSLQAGADGLQKSFAAEDVGPGGHREAALRPCSNGIQQHPGLHEEEGCYQMAEGGPSSLLSTAETTTAMKCVELAALW